MKGVILAPVLAAFLAMMVTGSAPIAAGAFFIVLCVAALAIAGEFRKHSR